MSFRYKEKIRKPIRGRAGSTWPMWETPGLSLGHFFDFGIIRFRIRGFRILGFRVIGFRITVEGLGFRINKRVEGLGFWLRIIGFRIQDG